MLVSVVSALTVVFLAEFHVIALATRDTEFRDSVSFSSVGLVTYLIG